VQKKKERKERKKEKEKEEKTKKKKKKRKRKKRRKRRKKIPDEEVVIALDGLQQQALIGVRIVLAFEFLLIRHVQVTHGLHRQRNDRNSKRVNERRKSRNIENIGKK
jgi:hypothetical protein